MAQIFQDQKEWLATHKPFTIVSLVSLAAVLVFVFTVKLDFMGTLYATVAVFGWFILVDILHRIMHKSPIFLR